MLTDHSAVEQEAFDQIEKWLVTGNLRPIVDSEYAFEDAQRAYERIMSGRAKGKVVVRF